MAKMCECGHIRKLHKVGVVPHELWCLVGYYLLEDGHFLKIEPDDDKVCPCQQFIEKPLTIEEFIANVRNRQKKVRVSKNDDNKH